MFVCPALDGFAPGEAVWLRPFAFALALRPEKEFGMQLHFVPLRVLLSLSGLYRQVGRRIRLQLPRRWDFTPPTLYKIERMSYG